MMFESVKAGSFTWVPSSKVYSSELQLTQPGIPKSIFEQATHYPVV